MKMKRLNLGQIWSPLPGKKRTELCPVNDRRVLSTTHKVTQPWRLGACAHTHPTHTPHTHTHSWPHAHTYTHRVLAACTQSWPCAHTHLHTCTHTPGLVHACTRTRAHTHTLSPGPVHTHTPYTHAHTPGPVHTHTVLATCTGPRAETGAPKHQELSWWLRW